MAKVTPRLISLLVASTSAGTPVDRSDEVGKSVIKAGPADSGFLTIAASRSGGARSYSLEMTVAQDHASGTLWDLIWTGAGTQVPGRYAPYGNTTASVAQPHYTFTAVVSEPDGDFLGSEANASASAVATVDVSWDLIGKPVKVTS